MVASGRRQFTALFLKNLTLQKHQKGTTLVQLLIPFVLVLLVGLIQILIDNLLRKNTDETFETYGRVDLTAVLPVINGTVNWLSILVAPPFFFFTAPPEIRSEVGESSYNGTGSGLLGEIDQSIQPPFLTMPLTFWPFLYPEDSEESMYDTLIQIYRKWKIILNDSGIGTTPDPEERPKILNDTIQWLREREYEELPPFGAIAFQNISNSSITYTAMAASRYGGWEPKSIDSANVSDLEILFIDIDRRGSIINLIHNAYFNYINPDAEEKLKITTYYQGFPEKYIFAFDISSIAGVFLYGFVSSLLLPVFIANLVVDKQEKVLLMMQMSGLRMSIYWLVAYLYDMFLYAIVVIVIYITSYIFKMRLFTQTSPLLLIIFFFLWGNALIGFCFLLSTFFSKSRTASVVGYLVVIISVLISNLLNSSVFLAASPPFYYLLYPPFAFYRAVFVLEDACIDLMCFQLSDLVENEELLSLFFYLLGESLVLFPLTYYLQSVLPNEFGVRKSPFFPLEPLFKLCRPAKKKSGYETVIQDEEDNEVKLQLSADSNRRSSETIEDEDVAEERRRIAKGDYPSTAQVVVNHITKEYDGRYGQPKKKALKGVSFFIDENECFGLLGGNGAGKTTLISILTGVFSCSAGTGTVAGFDISTEMDGVQSQIGVCPQFDIFYPELTTREHLLFYARLKGIENVQEVANRIMEKMGLFSVADRQSRNLSGGMRRRLSMGIAIIGEPKIVILDEPTTGLDPLTRRQIWELLTELKKNRSIILTTHSMEEADVLCTRIGIMSRGLMKCIGTQERLKSKFGSGYALSIFVHPSHIKEATTFIEARFPFAELEETFAGSLVFRIAKEKLVVSDLFQGMQTERPSCIYDWGLSMTTLEDVFVNIVKMDDIEEERNLVA